MQTVYNLSEDFLQILEGYREWVFSDRIQDAILNKIEWQLAPMKQNGESKKASSLDFLNSIDHNQHIGFPTDQYGINLNYNFLREQRLRVDPQFFEEIRTVNNDLDDQLQMLLGARFCALKMFYPKDGYIAWHTNWNVPGYNIIFTYSKTGDGHWRHIDPTGANSTTPNPAKLVHIDDVPGWHCKFGYFGKKEETDRIVWHSAYTNEPRITISYVIFEKNVWDNMVDELSAR